MSRRTDRVGHLIRNTLGSILLAKLSDPRFDPLKVSITRVEVTEDLLQAKVFVSVAGESAEQNKAVAALRHAAGYLQEKMMEQIQLRFTPKLDFRIDTKYQKTLETLHLISEVSAELRAKDEQNQNRPDETARSEIGIENE
jgi:ribosome-binding factor A